MLILGDAGAPSHRTLVIIHGILGSAKNWRTFGRKLAQARPGWRVVLWNLRNHGDAAPTEPPHDIAACAEDLRELFDTRGVGPAVVIGHSFGGKVALAYGASEPPGLASLWILDSVPWRLEPQELDTQVQRVLELVGSLSVPLASRDVLRDAFRTAGLSAALAGWMTTNLRRGDGGFVWRFELRGVRTMIEDYQARDDTEWLKRATTDVTFVRGGASARWTPTATSRLRSIIAKNSHLRDYVLEGAGHWVHVDRPDALQELLLTYALPSTGR